MITNLPFKRGLVIYGSYPEVLTGHKILIEQLLKVSTDEYFEVVELPVVNDVDSWLEIKRIVDESGIDVVASAGPSCVLSGWNLSSTNKLEREKAISGMKNAIDYAYFIGARELAFLSGRDPGEGNRGIAYNILLESFEILAKYTKEKATDYLLYLSLEPADRELTHKQLVGPTQEALDFMVKATQLCHAINLTLDMSHIAQLYETFEQATANLRGFVGHAHLANAFVRDPSMPEFGDKHPKFGLPGSEYNVRDITKYIELLFNNCFKYVTYFPYGKPVISLEVKPTNLEFADLTLAGAKRAMSLAIGDISFS